MSTVRVAYPALNRSELLERLRKASTRLRRALPVTRVILFGSYAVNRYTAASDIDLLIVYEGPKRKDAYRIVAGEIRLPRLELRVYTEREYRALLAESPKFAGVLAAEGLSVVGGARVNG